MSIYTLIANITIMTAYMWNKKFYHAGLKSNSDNSIARSLNISATLSDLDDISFTWSSVTAATHCPAVNYYNILASNCGSCPTTTNYTNATCTDVLAKR